MSEHEHGPIKGLPENAYTELKPGETYEPIMSADKVYPEVNSWSVIWGIIMAAVFSAAAAYLGLKIGQVFEAAIPIAIIAVGLSTVFKRKGALGENVIIQSIGASSGVIVAGAIFTLPALYILNLQVQFYQIFMSSLLGGFLGILFLIPFRKYFVSEMHGKYPFPEATATTEVLVSGAKGGNQARLLLVAGESQRGKTCRWRGGLRAAGHIWPSGNDGRQVRAGRRRRCRKVARQRLRGKQSLC